MIAFTGKVTEGSKRASTLGYPTVNIPLPQGPVSGIYAGKVIFEEESFDAAVFVDPTRKILEAYLLDFSGDLYGKEISIELFEKIRENEKFSDDTKLKEAIANDVAHVRTYFNQKS